MFICATVKTHNGHYNIVSPSHQWEKLDDLPKETTVGFGFEFSGLPQSPLPLLNEMPSEV